MTAKRSIAPLVCGRVRLRLLEEADLPMTLAWRNDADIRKWFFTSDPIPPDRHRAWFLQYEPRDDDFVFVIEEIGTLKRPVGQVSIYNVDWPNRRAELGRVMIGDPEARGQGLARAAMMRLVDEALNAWNLDELTLECLTANTRALALYAACGFESAGVFGSVTRMTRRKEAP